MQPPQQSCPRCHSTTYSTKPFSLRLTKTRITQELAAMPPWLFWSSLCIIIVGFVATVRLGILVALDISGTRYDPLFFVVTPVFIVGTIFILVVVKSFISYFQAPVVKGIAYKCTSCQFDQCQMASEPVQKLEHIRYLRSQYTQSHLIEGVQCPNLDCSSIEVISWPYSLRYTHSRFHWLSHNKNWLLKGRKYICRNCNYSWIVGYPPDPSPEIKLKWYEEALAKSRAANKKDATAFNLLYIGHYTYVHKRDSKTAMALYQQSLQMVHETNNQRLVANCFNHIGRLLARNGQLTEAAQLLKEGVEILREKRIWSSYAGILHSYGEILTWQFDLEKAADVFKESLLLSRKMEGYNPGTTLWDLQGLAEVLLKRQEIQPALRLCAAVEALRRHNNVILPATEQEEYETLANTARRQTDPTTYVNTWREGSQLTLDRAIEYACSLTTAPLG